MPHTNAHLALIARLDTSKTSIAQMIAIMDALDRVGEFGNVIVSVAHRKAKSLRIEQCLSMPD